MAHRSQRFVYLGPLAAVLIYALILPVFGYVIAVTLAITALTAIWWISEALPIAATSLVPVVLFPVFGVLTHKQAAASFGSHIIILLMAGFMLAKGIEKSGLHKRLALNMLQLTGGRSGRPLIFAFMLSAAFLSMWISNTASCLVLMPIALGVLSQLKDEKLTIPLILAVAFACNLGGIATLVGTPTNLVFAGVYEEITHKEFSFLSWLKIGLPTVFIGIPLVGLWLGRNLTKGEPIAVPQAESWNSHERRVCIIFAVVVLLWVFRLEPFGGWSALFANTTAGDSTVALLGVLLMFLTASGNNQQTRLLDWQTAVDIPWHMIMLFAGGICIAKAFQLSGTAEVIGQSFAIFSHWPTVLVIFAVCLMLTFLTEITSNVATTTLFMPIMAAAAQQLGLSVETLMLPAAMSASCAFMLPVATAPNAIAYGTGKVSFSAMAKEGLLINLLMACVICGVFTLSYGLI